MVTTCAPTRSSSFFSIDDFADSLVLVFSVSLQINKQVKQEIYFKSASSYVCGFVYP